MLDNAEFVGYIGESITNSCVVPNGVSLRPVPLTGSDTAPLGMDVAVLASAPALNLRLINIGGVEGGDTAV